MYRNHLLSCWCSKLYQKNNIYSSNTHAISLQQIGIYKIARPIVNKLCFHIRLDIFEQLKDDSNIKQSKAFSILHFLTYISWVQFWGLSILYPMVKRWSSLSGKIPGYGAAPRVTSSQRRMPKLQTSLLLVYKWSRRLSGANHFTGTENRFKLVLSLKMLGSELNWIVFM